MNKFVRVYFPSILFYVVFSACLLIADGIVVRKFVPDLLFLGDSIWRSYYGHIPHVDFVSPIGQAFYWPYEIVSRISGGSILDIMRANALVAAFALALCLLCLPARLPPASLFLATSVIVVGALTGRSVDLGVTTYDFLAPYNRWAWSFTMIATLIVILPRRVADKRGCLIDEICLALTLTLLFFLKISFFAGALALVIGASMLKVFGLRSSLVVAIYLFVAIGTVELLFQNVAEYASDLAFVASVIADEGQNGRVPRIVASALFGVVTLVLALVVILFASKPRSVRTWLRFWWRECAIAALVVGSATAIKTQNHPRWEIAMLSLALLIVAERTARRREELSRAGDDHYRLPEPVSPRIWRPIAALVVTIALIPHLIADSASLVTHLIETKAGANCSSPVLRNTPMAPLLFPKANPSSAPAGPNAKCADMYAAVPGELPQSDEAEYRRLLQTVGLLRGHVQAGDVIFALEFANPYPFIFRSPPPKGGLIFWDRGRTFSYKIHPHKVPLIEQVTLAVQTDYPTRVDAEIPSRIPLMTRLRTKFRPIYDDGTGTGQDMWAVYGNTVRTRFEPIAFSNEVTLWQRREHAKRTSLP